MIKPSGGAGQRAPAASQADPKLQNEFGLKSGKTRRIFVGVNVSFASLSVGQRCRSKSAKLYNGGINDVPFQRKSSLFWIVFINTTIRICALQYSVDREWVILSKPH